LLVCLVPNQTSQAYMRNCFPNAEIVDLVLLYPT